MAKALNRFLNGATPAERLYPIDADLRPEGKQGPMARSRDGFHQLLEHLRADVGAPGHDPGPHRRR